MSNQNRDERTQQFKKKSSHPIRKIIIVMIILMAGTYAYPRVKQFVKNVSFVNQYTAKPVVAIPTASDIDTRIAQVKGRAGFQTKMAEIQQSQATNIAINELKAEAQKRYDEAMAKYEKGLEAVRKSDLNLQ